MEYLREYEKVIVMRIQNMSIHQISETLFASTVSLLDLADVCSWILNSCENSPGAFWVSPPFAFHGLIPRRHFCERRQSYANKRWPVNLAWAWRKFNTRLTSPVTSCSDSARRSCRWINLFTCFSHGVEGPREYCSKWCSIVTEE